MRTQTKCTLSLCGMLIVEILPVPFTAIYGIYAVRKRPDWIPEVVERLYADKAVDAGKPVKDPLLQEHDPMKVRKNCTIAITTMFLIDVIVPFTVPFGIYIVRKRPHWFENLVARLYSDRLRDSASGQGDAAEDISEILDRRYQELERKNLDFARSMHRKLG